jgi:hypothetical protein
MTRRKDVKTFYKILQILENNVGGRRKLSDCDGKMEWPKRGVYFFFENDELRENGKMRVVRVGTHALKMGSKSTLWKRLRQHKGTEKGRHPGGGNHRGSIFRLHVGAALISKNKLNVPTWLEGKNSIQNIRDIEYRFEKHVTNHIGSMPFLWVKVDDKPGPNSLRGYIERNAIGLLSNYNKNQQIDTPSDSWIGQYAYRDRIKKSGLWNVNHVDEGYNPDFLNVLIRKVEEM